MKRSRRTISLTFAAMLCLLLGSLVLSLFVGPTRIPPREVVRALLSWRSAEKGEVASDRALTRNIRVLQLRLPRALLAALVGCALAVAGISMQALFRNPLAEPGILGVSSGGSLGAVLSIALGLEGLSLLALPVAGVVGSLAAVFLVYIVGSEKGRGSTATLLLTGVAVASFGSALLWLILAMVTHRFDVAVRIVTWLMGSFEGKTWEHLLFASPFVGLGVGLSFLYLREMDLLVGGEETAHSLGVDRVATRRILIFSAGTATGAAVAVSGIIGFIGLIVPHLARLLVGPQHRRAVPASLLLGATILLLADVASRAWPGRTQIPVGVISAMAGTPFFIYLLKRKMNQSFFTT